MQGRISASLVTDNMIINLSPVFKRLESDVYLGPGLLKSNILKCFRWPILYGVETVFQFLNSYLEKPMRSAIK